MTQKVVLVTGATRGIGEFLCRTFLEQGAVVYGCGRSETCWEADGFSYTPCDVSDERAVSAMLRSLWKTEKRLDAVINNAGVASMNHSLLTPKSSMEQIFDVNVIGTMLVCREAAKLMKKSGGGRIVNTSSVAVPLQLEGESAYAASKSAIETFSKIFAREVAPFGITCNVIAPSPIETDLIKGVPKEKIEQLVDKLAVKRTGTFQDVLNVINFYLSEDSSAITGQILYLGGVS